MYPIKLCCSLLCFLLLNFAAAQTPYLEQKITLQANNQPLADIFRSISAQCPVVFSYNPANFNDKRKISIHCNRKPLRLLMQELLAGTGCGYRMKKNYLILFCDAKPQSPATTAVLISGYVINAEDSSAVSNASIYIREGKYSSLTDQYGHFSLSYPALKNNISLLVARESYEDTSLALYNAGKNDLIIYLYPRKTNTELNRDSLAQEEPAKLEADSSKQPLASNVQEKRKDIFEELIGKLKNLRFNLLNIKDTLQSSFSVSLVPYISTNKLLSVNTINKFSLNILSGQSKGVKMFELGGLVNLVKGDVLYVQVAGIGNQVTGKAKGFQLGGIYNLLRQDMNGLQVAGIYNQAQAVEGLQLGGIANHVKQKTAGGQVAGIVNNCPQVMGYQLGGIANLAHKSVRGGQLAGIVNITDTLQGIQVSGIVNIARNMKGLQISLINISDTCSGIPLGFLSYVKKGYHSLELSLDEMLFTQFNFRTGAPQFHNIFSVAASAKNNTLYWAYGYGLGSSFRISNAWNLLCELGSRQINSMNGPMRLSLLNRFSAGFEYKYSKKISLLASPSYNVYVSDSRASDYQAVYSGLAPYSFYNRTSVSAASNVKMWVGASITVRFL